MSTTTSAEHFFEVQSGIKFSDREAARRDRVARKFGGAFVNPCLPEGWRSWFAIPNRGEPFDSQSARAIRRELRIDTELTSSAECVRLVPGIGCALGRVYRCHGYTTGQVEIEDAHGVRHWLPNAAFARYFSFC